MTATRYAYANEATPRLSDLIPQRPVRPSIRLSVSDTHQGVVSDPISLHKYLYAGANPINNIDPTGRSFIGDFATTLAMRATLFGTIGAAVGATTFKITGGSALKGAYLGFIGGASLAIAFAEGRGPEAIFLGVAQGLGTAFGKMIVTMGQGREYPVGLFVQDFIEGFAYGVLSTAVGAKLQKWWPDDQVTQVVGAAVSTFMASLTKSYVEHLQAGKGMLTFTKQEARDALFKATTAAAVSAVARYGWQVDTSQFGAKGELFLKMVASTATSLEGTIIGQFIKEFSQW